MINSKNLLILLLLIGGGVSALAFAPFNYISLLYLGYIILFYSIYKAKNIKDSLIYGISFGLSHFLVGTYWLFTISNNYTNSNKTVLIIIIACIILILSTYYAFFALIAQLFKSLSKRLYLWIILILPLSATFMQWLKSWFLTGFTWLRPSDTLFNFGYSHFLPFTGPLGVEFIFFTLISSILLFFIYKNIYSIFIIFLSIFILIGSKQYLDDISFTKPLNKKLTIEAISTDFSRDSKAKEYMVIERIKKFQQLSLQEPLADLVIWPESSYSIDNRYIQGKLEKGFKKLRDKNVSLLYGAYINKGCNSLNVIKDEFNRVVYIKQHLIPFGEYTPKWLNVFKKYLPSFFMDELLTKNNNNNILVKNIKISSSICYELLFSNEIRKSTRDSNIMVAISDLGWFEHSWAQAYLLEIARERAIENQKPLIFVSNQGDTAFIDSNGDIKKIVSKDATLALFSKVQPRKGTTIYAKYGNKTILYLLLVLFLLYVLLNFKFNTKESYGL